MKKAMLFVGISTIMYACGGSSYDKSPEDWSKEVCTCASEKGTDAQECQDKLKELKTYYADEDYAMHDKATTLIGQDCPEVLFAGE